MGWHLVLLLLLAIFPSGCGLAALTTHLETHQVRSCIYTLGFLTPFHAVRTITVTGGMSMDQCHALR